GHHRRGRRAHRRADRGPAARRGLAGRRPVRGGGGRYQRGPARWPAGPDRRRATGAPGRPRRPTREGVTRRGHPTASGGPRSVRRQATSSQSTLGPPAAPVAAARTALLPAARFTVTVAVAQVFHEPVPGKFTVTGVPPP